ncbi:MAG: B12-binding domain-containing radical SAM protein [Thermodesulfovibrionales bacterium]
MKPLITLINPPVYDFAAASPWSRPIGLLEVAGYLSRFRAGLRLIDCMEAFHGRGLGTGRHPCEAVPAPEVLRGVPRGFKRFGMGRDELARRLRAGPRPDIVLVAAPMSHWYPGAEEAIALVKSMAPGLPVVLGGAYPTLWTAHAAARSGADFIYTGPVGTALKAAFRTFGLTLRERHRPRPWWRLGLSGGLPFAPVLTSRGCPWRCPYCASHILAGPFSQRPPGEVAAEIRGLYALGVRDFAFYDDALLVNAGAHLEAMLKEVAPFVPGARFHCPNGLHAALMDRELAMVMKRAGFRTLRLSLETVNEERQKALGGKVTADGLRGAVAALKAAGFSGGQVGVRLMCGLPGQPLSEVREGVRFLKALGVRIHLAEFSPVPGTGSWEELGKMGVVGEGFDPLLTNNTAFTLLFSGYSPTALEALKLEARAHNEALR